jgi:toxin ParE1/3/4
MPRLAIAPEARQDLQEIRDGIAKDDPNAAHPFVMRLRDRARMLAGAPALGRNRPELGARVRSCVADRYLLCYCPLRHGAGIERVRVLHGARNVDAVFSGDKD